MSSCVFFILAGYSFFISPKRPGATKSNEQHETRGSLTKVQVYRYLDSEIISYGEAEKADLLEPNQLEIVGGLRGTRKKLKGEESISADAASVFFFASQIGAVIVGEAPLHFAEFRNNVRSTLNEYTVYTEEAQYYEKSKSISSQIPVRLEGSLRQLQSDRGFDYQLDSEKLRLFGKVQGSAFPK